MAERNHIIEVLITARDLASAALARHRRDLADVEKSQTRAAASTEKLDVAQQDLGKTVEGTSRTLDEHNRKALNAENAARRQSVTVARLAREYKEETRAAREAGKAQQSFFEEVSNTNQIISQQIILRDRLLRDIEGKPLPPGFEKRRQSGLESARRRLPRVEDEGLIDPGVQLSLEERRSWADVMRDVNRVMNLMPDVEREADSLEKEFRDLTVASKDFFQAIKDGDGAMHSLLRQFRQLRGSEGFEGGGRVITNLLKEQEARLRAELPQAGTRDERLRIERQLRSVQLLKEELVDLKVTVRDIDTLGRGLDLSGLTGDELIENLGRAERAARRTGDALGEDGVKGHIRDIGRGGGADFDRGIARPLARRVNPVLERFTKLLGVSRQELDQFGESVNQRQKGLLEISRFDDTVQQGLRRLARLMVIVATFIPFLVAGFGTLVGAVVALGGGVTALAGAFGQLAGVVATLPALLGATLGALAAFQLVVGPGIKNITDRFKEAEQVRESARKQSSENTAAITKAEDALGDLIRRNAEAESDLRRQISRQRRDSAEQVRDQERDLVRLRRENNEQEMDAVRDLRRAKIDAAKDAKEAEQDYRDLIKQNAIDEREAAAELSLRRAQLGALKQQGASDVVIGQAQAAAFGAERVLVREQTENRRQEAAALKDINDTRRTDQRQIADAERNLARIRRENREQELDAEKRLSRTRRDNAQQLVDLQRQLSRTIRDNADAQLEAVVALQEQQRKASGELTDTLADLEPTEKRIVLQLIRIRDEWEKLTRSTRLGAERLGERALSFLESRLPAIAQRANQFTNVIIALGEQAFARFTRPEAIDRVNRILDDSVDLTRQLGRALINIVDAFLIIADAAAPVTRHIGDLVEKLGEGILRVTQQGEQSGALEGFFAGTNRVLDLTIDLVTQLGGAILNVLRIAAPFGEILLGDLVEWAREVRSFTENEGPAIERFFADSIPVVEALGGLLAEVVKQLFLLGRNLIRPDADTGEVFLIETINDIKEGLPGLREFFQELTEEAGPKLLDFLGSLGRFIGSLVGPNGPFIIFLGVLTEVFDAVTALPDGIERLGLAFFAFGGIINTVARQLRLLIASLTLTSRRVAAGGAASSASAARGTMFGLGIAALIAFPGLIEDINAVLTPFIRLIQGAFDALDDFLGIFGEGGGAVNRFIRTLVYLEIAFRLLGGVSAIGLAIRSLRIFIALLRASQAQSAFGRVIDALAGFFALLAPNIAKAIARMRDWVRTQRQARRENQLYAASNIANAFSDLIRPIGLAIQALIDYIRQVRAARQANRALAISNATLGFSNVFAGLTGLTGLAGLAGRLGGLMGTLTRLAPLAIRAAGGIGLIITAAVGLDKALERIGAPQWVQTFLTPLMNLGDLKEGLVNDIRSIGRALGFVSDKEPALDRLGRTVTTTLRGLNRSFSRAGSSVFTRLSFVLDDFGDSLDTLATNLQNFLDTFDDIRSSVGTFIAARIDATPVPAQLALDALDRGEVLRDRAQRRRQANEDVAEARRQERRQEQSLLSARRRLERLQSRLAFSRTGAFGRGVADPTLTPQQRTALRAEIRDQRGIVRQREQELREARQRVKEVAEARRETLRQVAVEERREVLERQAALQEAQRVKEIAAAQRRANNALDAYFKALDKGKIPLKKAWQKLEDALFNLGVSREDSRAWRAGRKMGNDFNSGLSDAVRGFGKAFNTLFAKEIKDQNLGAPVVIVTSVPTIKKVINNPDKITAGDLERGGFKIRAAGGPVNGREGAAVPIMAHAGEWVLNHSQQWQAALMAGVDRSVLQRALFHKMQRPRFAYQMGGVVQPVTVAGSGGTTFLTPINIATTSPQVDADYVARALESRMRQVI